MNSFAWLHVLCLCPLLFDLVCSTAIYQPPAGDGAVGGQRREKPLFKTPRISSGAGIIFTHPWQLIPPMRPSITHPMFWKANGDEELFLRHKRKLVQSKVASMPNDQQSGEPETEVSTPSPVKEDPEPRSHFKGGSATRNFGSNISSLGFRNKFNSASPTDKTKLVNKFWNAVYNPLPYGAPRSIQTADEAEAILRQKQASGLPFARTATREKERERAELRLPIPDSEIPSPGHYRQPVNESLLQASFNTQSRSKTSESNTNNPSGRAVNVEAFRILMEIIKSLRILNNQSGISSAVTEELAKV